MAQTENGTEDIVACNLSMLNSGLMADVEFRVGQNPGKRESIKAHKYILVSRSPVFEEMFATDTTEIRSNVVTVEDLEPSIFKEILRYLYTGAANPDVNKVEELVYASRKYLLPNLETKCLMVMYEKLAAPNVLELINLGTARDIKHLTSFCVKYIAKRFSYLSKTAAFLDITHSSLCALLTCDEFDLSERDIYLASVKWAEGKLSLKSKEPTDKSIRKELGGALKLIRFPTMTNETFSGTVGLKKVLTVREKDTINKYITKKAQGSVVKEAQGSVDKKAQGSVDKKAQGSVDKKAQGSVDKKAPGSVDKKAQCRVDKVNGFSTVSRKDPVVKMRVLEEAQLLGACQKAPDSFSMYVGFMTEVPVMLNGIAFLSTEQPCVIERFCYWIFESPKSEKPHENKRMEYLEDILSPGGNVMIPVYFNKPVYIERYTMHYVAVYLNKPPNTARKTVIVPQHGSCWHKTVSDVGCFLYWSRLEGFENAGIIPQILFTPVSEDKDKGSNN